jgi:hypothetical protein
MNFSIGLSSSVEMRSIEFPFFREWSVVELWGVGADLPPPKRYRIPC